MNTEDITRKCDSCKEPVSIDASKCPHCQSQQLMTRGRIAATTILGLVGLPFTYAALPIALDRGIPNGFAEGIGTGLAWGVTVLGPLFLLVGFGAYIQRRNAIKEAKQE